jgi:MFS family permease
VAAIRVRPDLPRAAWVLLGGDALSALGSGLTLPFFLVYLYEFVGIEVGLAGLVLSTIAVAGLAGNPTGGWLSDRYGARNALVLGLLIAAGGALSIALVTERWHAFAAAALLGFGAAVVWPAQDTLLASVVTPEQRGAAFAIRHATMNLGLGAGALLATLVVAGSSVRLELLYVLDGLTFLAFIPVLLACPGCRSRLVSCGRRRHSRDSVHCWATGASCSSGC